MKVSKTSWHYKLLSDEHKYNVRTENVTLCTYFWMAFFGLLSWVLIGVLFLAAAAISGFVLYLFLYVWYFMIAGSFFGVETFVVEDIEISFFLHGLAIGGWFINMFIRYKKKNPYKQYIPKDNLFIEYAKAKKQKICPFIEVE